VTLTESLFSGTIPRLNGLRALCAFFVVAYHYGISSVGGFGHLVFFVSSGFLITWLLLVEHTRSGTVSLRSFYARRSWRIFPAFYVYWILVTAILVLGNKHIL
jgi:peptidoglycan/LPS O-acetylase OafA/YrhL